MIIGNAIVVFIVLTDFGDLHFILAQVLSWLLGLPRVPTNIIFPSG